MDRGTRSVNWSTSLLSLLKALESKVDVITLAQATAYHLMILGNSNFDKDNHENALETLSLSRTLLTSLAKCSKSSKEEALANSFIDNMEAMIRFCCYNLGKETNVVDLDGITSEYSTEEIGEKWLKGTFWNEILEKLKEKETENEGGKKNKGKLEIDWNGKKIQIRNPELAEEIEKVRREEENLKSSQQKGVEGDSNVTSNNQKKEKREKVKKERLTHAQRNEKKRGGSKGNSNPSTNNKVTKSNNLSPFDSLLVTLTSASEISSRLLSDHASALAKSHSGRYASAGDDLRDANEWILYKLFALRIRRNESLIKEVESKAEKRDKRSKERIEKKIELVRNGGKGTIGSNNVNKNKKKKVVPQVKEKKKNQPGSRAKRTRSTPKTKVNKKARSGTRAFKAKKVEIRSKQLEELEKEASSRRSYRLIPSLSRLLDSTSISLDSIADLTLCESNPDIASLIECKAYLNKSQILKTLARGYHLSSSTISKETNAIVGGNSSSEVSKAKIRSCKISLFLLERSKLFVRQSKGSLDLIEREEIDEELDQDFPRHVLNDQAQEMFVKELEELDDLIKDCQKSLWLTLKTGNKTTSINSKNQSGSGTGTVGIGKDGLPNTKSAIVIRDLLSKNLQLDEREIEEASKIPSDRSKELEEEFSSTFGSKKGKKSLGQGQVSKPNVVKTQPVGSSSDDEADFRDADAGSPIDDEDEEAEFDEADEFDDDEEEEEEKDGAVKGGNEGQKKGWLGGWFGR